jgi:hypothetical protein
MTRAAAALTLSLLSIALAAHAAGPWSFHKTPQGLRKAVADGRAETPGEPVAAMLRVQCKPGASGSLCVSLKVEEAKATSRFDFAAFEGPQARAAAQPLLSARAGADGAVAIEAAVAGHWTSEPPGSFSFDLCAANRGESDASRLARAIAAGVGEVELAIHDPSGNGREIRARFPSDSQDEAVEEALRSCWQP